MRSHRSARRAFSGLATLILLVGITVSAEAGAVTESKTLSTRALMAPVGVWSGTGDHPAEFNDYTVVAVMAGAAGSQSAFFGEYVVGGECSPSEGEFGQASMLGTAALTTAGFLIVSGDVVCADSGDLFASVEFRFKLDTDADTLTPYTFDGNNWVVDEGYPGPFTRKCAGANSTLVGTSGDDVLIGTAGHDVIDGLGGNDTLKGKGGMDILCGQGGRDKLVGGGDIDVLVGAGKRDRLNGGPGWDLLLGGGGPDVGNGGGGNDVLFGDVGGDNLSGGTGTDYADGGAGSDSCTAETVVSC